MILVTGATGNIGRPLVGELTATEAPVRALTRNPRRAGFPAQVDTAEGDPARPDTVRAAMEGVEALFLVPPGGRLPADVLPIAAEAGVRRVVLVSTLLARTHPSSAIGAGALAGERAVRDSGLEWTLLRPWEFASNTLAWASRIRDGDTVRLPTAGAASPAVHPGDIAAVAARALTEDGHRDRTYPLTGPEAVTAEEKVAAIGAELGRRLRFEVRPDPQDRERIAREAPDEVAEGVMVPGVTTLESPGVLSTVEEVTGAPARDFRTWVRDHRHAFEAPGGA